MIPRKNGAFAALFLLAGCSSLGLSGITDMSAVLDERPPDAEPGVCYGKVVVPALIETVTQQLVTRAAVYDDNGALVSPAAYRTETVQRILRERADNWFKAPCPKDQVGDFTASLQRALKVRGIYFGVVTGKLDMRTRRAIRRYQQPLGLDSATLSLASARKLGLVAIERQLKTAAKE
jgi:putative peptidoglycan binding protein